MVYGYPILCVCMLGITPMPQWEAVNYFLRHMMCHAVLQYLYIRITTYSSRDIPSTLTPLLLCHFKHFLLLAYIDGWMTGSWDTPCWSHTPHKVYFIAGCSAINFFFGKLPVRAIIEAGPGHSLTGSSPSSGAVCAVSSFKNLGGELGLRACKAGLFKPV